MHECLAQSILLVHLLRAEGGTDFCNGIDPSRKLKLIEQLPAEHNPEQWNCGDVVMNLLSARAILKKPDCLTICIVKGRCLPVSVSRSQSYLVGRCVD
jgi:hypothetical protein